ncbi:MAG: EscU/YscU/HrcU family type III secretion system export apparatus switch protein [Pseudomonadota bacterium]|nr:EscU/YscU/HrcU family type III secretion system export apparatus switch protein [Pseudomonadota bacterium]
MSDEVGEKTEEASERQIEKFRGEGRVATSRELLAAVSLGAGALGLVTVAPTLTAEILGLANTAFGHVAAPSLSQADVPGLVHGALLAVGPSVVGVLGGAAFVTVGAGVLLTGFNVSLEAIEPKLSHLDPIGGASRLVSWKSWEGLLKALVAAGVVGWSAWAALRPWWDWLPVAPAWTIAGQAQVLLSLGTDLVSRAVPAAIALGVADFGWQKWRLMKEMRMTRQSVKEEHKDQDGDPHVKAHRRRRARQLAMGRQIQDVPKADVVVVNPTHYAVALRYRKDENAAPVIVARGVDHVALRIKAAAMRADVPIVENRALARALYAQGRSGAAIPRDLYGPVAQVLAAVYRRRHRKS